MSQALPRQDKEKKHDNYLSLFVLKSKFLNQNFIFLSDSLKCLNNELTDSII